MKITRQRLRIWSGACGTQQTVAAEDVRWQKQKEQIEAKLRQARE